MIHVCYYTRLSTTQHIVNRTANNKPLHYYLLTYLKYSLHYCHCCGSYILADCIRLRLMLQCCVCLSPSVVCTECIGYCVLEQKLIGLLRAYRKSYVTKSIGTKINDRDLCLEVISTEVVSTIALHSTLNISETVRDRSLVPKDHQYIGNGIWGIKWSRER